MVLKLPSQKYLKECFDYDPKTGILIWRARPVRHFPDVRAANKWNGRWSGKPAGRNIKSHSKVGITTGPKKTIFFAHRIIWKLMTGEDPGRLEVDHKNTNPSDNRWKNLRLATNSQNAHNSRTARNNTSGIKGVSWHCRLMKWQARVECRGVMNYAEYFDDFDNAVKAIKKVRKQLHREYANHG